MIMLMPQVKVWSIRHTNIKPGGVKSNEQGRNWEVRILSSECEGELVFVFVFVLNLKYS